MSQRRLDSVFFGLDEPDTDLQQVDQTAIAVGRNPGVISTFLKLDSDLPSTALAMIRQAGKTPFVTLEPWSKLSRPGDVEQSQFSLRSIVSGRHDLQLERLAIQLATLRQPFYLRFAQEMNAWWYPWCEGVNGNRPGDYIAAWRYTRDLFTRMSVHKARWIWSPNKLLTTYRHLPDFADLYPGDKYTDYVGLTGYSAGAASAEESLGPSVRRLFTISSRPVLLSEIGARDPGAASWISSLGPFIMKNSRIRGFVYFDTSPQSTGATGDYRIASNPSRLKAFQNLMSDLYGVDLLANI